MINTLYVLNKEQVIHIHDELIKRYGGENGLLSNALLESALNAPFQSVFGVDAFPSIEEKAARLCFGISNNHSFKDGNKRLGGAAMVVFLEMNGFQLTLTNEQLIDVILKISSSQMSLEIFTNIIKNNTKEVFKKERELMKNFLSEFEGDYYESNFESDVFVSPYPDSLMYVKFDDYLMKIDFKKGTINFNVKSNSCEFTNLPEPIFKKECSYIVSVLKYFCHEHSICLFDDKKIKRITDDS